MTAVSSSLSENAEEVRRLDRDRFVTALFAPAEHREDLFALYAFNLEIARIRELVSEAMLGSIRLQWWREALDQVCSGQSTAHPVADALGQTVRRCSLSREPFERLLEAREADLEIAPIADMEGLERYAEGTASTLAILSLEVLGAADEAALLAARHIGIAWALTGLLRAVPYHASMGRIYLPDALLAAERVAPEDLLAGKPSPGLVKVGEAVAERARHHLAEARAARKAVRRAALPGLLTAPLAEGYLNALSRRGGNLMDTHWSMTRPRPARLAWHMLWGRY